MLDEKMLLRVPEACDLLSVNEKTLRELISRGVLTAVKLGPRTTRVHASSINAVCNPDDKFDAAREALYARLNSALSNNDIAEAYRVNWANRYLSRARDDRKGGLWAMAREQGRDALRYVPDCVELSDYVEGL